MRPYQRFAATIGAAAIAPMVPQRLDPTLAKALSRAHLALFPGRRRLVADRMRSNLGTDTDRDPAADASAYWLQRIETRWGQARGISVAGWKPAVEVSGLEHLRAALAGGKGAILWRISGHSAIPLNQGLAASGFAPVHLSRQNHLIFARDNRLGRATAPTIGRIVRRPEVAPLRERVVIGERSPAAAMRRLMSALEQNLVVTIVGDLPSGSKVVDAAVNQSTFTFANGGARLAVRTGAPLLPVSISRKGPLRYRVDIMEPLMAPVGASSTDAVASLIEQFAAVLAGYIRHDPSQWVKWRDPTS